MKPSETDMETFIYDEDTFYNTPHFHHMLRVEQKRTGRSEKPFLLMLLDLSGLKTRHSNGYIFERIKGTIVSCSRETDIRGWYEPYRIMGVIFTEMPSIDNDSIKRVFTKISNTLSDACGDDVVKKIKISLTVFRFPEMKNKQLMVSGF
ncbi:MAG: hypothetical protein ABFD82_21235 [Syntrophaceae bacterium]